MSGDLTPWQEAFARGLAEGRAQGDAYIKAGYSARGDTAFEAASRLAKNVKVAVRVRELQAEHAKAAGETVQTIAAKLNEMYDLAKEMRNPSAGTAAAMGLAERRVGMGMRSFDSR